MSDYLFAYGTLIPGCEPAAMAPVCARVELVGEATIPGTLYDLGSYPGVVEGQGVVHGVVLRVPPDAWAAMDAYEGCAGFGRATALFRRVMMRATLSTGDTLDCWIYLYACGTGGRRTVPSGDWRRRSASL